MPSTQSSSPQIAASHVAVCTFPFGSHPLSFFNLLRKLATEAPQIHFSFFTLPKANSIIKSSQKNSPLPTNLMSYDVDDGIPEGVNHLTIDLAVEVRHFLEQLPYNFEAKFPRTVYQLNPIPLTNYLKLKVKNLLYIGCSTLSITQENDGSSSSAGCLFSWLDRQKVGSVVYISFGTVLELESEELMALAEAIEFSGKPFLWSLKEKYKENLPKGFLERSKEKGKVVPWVAQRDVLQHVSIGVFVNHGGYNSMLESILGGVPMICRSVWADNHINAKVAEEVWGVAVRVEGRVITQSGIVKCLEMIFEQEKGKKMR
ncbi:anthocyanidin 3-O-galactosyltransferase F3GT1 [Jatropha curcas]|uniref:anthocyanidin 3-O-galactosyltransferase F3GT1 n=1 Tax=Jatropha curcas TaxID=180498 RepID=UPI001894C1C0|nr:anthocyanidin 3-O-galactosyltransferase F3GT1 [Jatropha curcas]